MTFEELIKDKIFELPLKQPKIENFKTFLTKKLKLFLEKVNSLDSGEIHQDKNHISTDFVKRTQKKIVENLILCVQEYYNGNPYKAYEKLDKVLRNDYKDLYEIIKQKEYAVNDSFFRIRLSDTNYPYQKKEMFHIPFELRNKVSTQRFSIPGFPSLYLGRTVYICWEELNRPSIDKIQAIRYKNIKPIRLLDLTPPNKECSNIDELYRFFMTFPLILCCSVKVRDTSDTFKPEYIIPQLLLQWIRNNDRIDGIQYKSTHITSKVFNENSELLNIVLPVKTNENKGICKKLVNYFECTDVVSWNLYQFATGGQIFIYSKADGDIVNKKIPKLELIEGKQYPYFYSTLGKLEHYLEVIDTKKIE
ncbi:RES domain-containing protein [Tenacibaculum sp. UWU-22]|uniref:RES domain-containing protein n=1 Tax=Tenacibaculum sp. UWU-22 TaxID=3234187 RepID=UPI0034DB2B18